MRTYRLDNYMDLREKINLFRLKEQQICSEHTHEFAEFIFVTCGKSIHWIDGKCYEAESGDLLFVNYGQIHAFEPKSDDYEYYNLLYVPEFFSDELIDSENIYEIFRISLFREFANEIEISQIVHFRGGEYREICKIVEDMEREFISKELGYCSVLNGYSRVLLSKILRKLSGPHMPSEETKTMSRLTAECMAYIDARCLTKITLKEIAAHSFYNPSYISRIFREQTGVSLSEYLKEKRMQEAARLLRESDLTNEEIMIRVGYHDKKQFYRNFREIYLETPAQYRKKIPTKK